MIHRRVHDDSGARVSRRIDAPSRKMVWRSRPRMLRRSANIRRGLAVYAGVAVIGVPLVVAVQGMLWFSKPSTPQSAFMPVNLGVLVALFAVLVPIAYRLLWRGERGWCLVLRCCPACNYDMDGLAPRDDGLTVCPECGGAWRLEPRASTPDASR